MLLLIIYQWELMYYRHNRSNKTFSPSKDMLLGGKLLLVCGNFYQLPPVQANSLLKCDKTSTPEAFVSVDLWLNTELVELDQIIPQKDDMLFIDLLNKMRVDNIDQSCEDISKSWLIQREDPKYLLHAFRIFVENDSVQRHNSFTSKNIQSKLFSTPKKFLVFRYFRFAE